MQFTAHVIKGSGRGKGLGTPTLNLDITQVPPTLKQGIYACRIKNEKCTHSTSSGQEIKNDGVLHYGPRPVFKDTPSCEVHLLDTELTRTPDSLTVEIIEKLREVRDFESVDALKEQIKKDIEQAKDILLRPSSPKGCD